MDMKPIDFLLNGVRFGVYFSQQYGRLNGCLCSYDAEYELAAQVISSIWVRDPVWLLESADKGGYLRTIEDNLVLIEGERVELEDSDLGKGSIDRKFFESLVLKFAQITVAMLDAKQFDFWFSKLDRDLQKRVLTSGDTLP
jgi:hypothetical protein